MAPGVDAVDMVVEEDIVHLHIRVLALEIGQRGDDEHGSDRRSRFGAQILRHGLCKPLIGYPMQRMHGCWQIPAATLA